MTPNQKSKESGQRALLSSTPAYIRDAIPNDIFEERGQLRQIVVGSIAKEGLHGNSILGLQPAMSLTPQPITTFLISNGHAAASQHLEKIALGRVINKYGTTEVTVES